MSTRERIPHTARFLQTFHTARPSYTTPQANEERSALDFVSGAAAAPAVQEIFIKGWRIRVGDGLVTEKQASWIVSIAETKDGVTDAMVKSLSTRLEQGFARKAASDFITKYKDLPTRAAATARNEAVSPGASDKEIANTTPVVAPGRYAVEMEGVLKFYRVALGKGQWAGKTFVSVQASDDWYPVRSLTSRNEVLRAISEDELTAARRYGQELGKCSRCGRTLTDETSRSYGIGPECRKK